MKAFFDTVRSDPFPNKLTAPQVSGMDGIVAEGARRGTALNLLAYILATTALETAYTMQPIHERGAVAYFDKYEPGTKIGKMLGNTQKGDGYKFRGRGLPQLTGRRNYALASKKLGVDFVKNPDLVLEPRYAIPIAFDGMLEGWFTSKKLSDYIDDIDESDAEDLAEFVNARRVVNGTDKAAKIGNHALSFERALAAINYPVKPKPFEMPAPTDIKPGATPVDTGQAEADSGNFPFWAVPAALVVIAIVWFVFFKR